MAKQGTVSYEIIIGRTRFVTYSRYELYDRIVEMTQDDYLADDILAWSSYAPVGDSYTDGNLTVGILGDWGLALQRPAWEGSLIII